MRRRTPAARFISRSEGTMIVRSSSSKPSRSTTSTTPARPWTRLTVIGIRLRRSSCPVRVTTPSPTSTSTVSGSTHRARRRTSWRTSWAIWSSLRRNTLSRTARLTMPTSGPAGSRTGSRLIWWRWSSRAASARLASGPTVMAGAVISSTAVSPVALARVARRWRPSNSRAPGGRSGNSSLGSRSASETTPTTRASGSRTGTALMRQSASSWVISLNGVCSSTVTTSRVITSRTRRRMATSKPAAARATTGRGLGQRCIQGGGHHPVAGVAVVDVIGQSVLDLDHSLHAADGPDQPGDEAALFGPALQHGHALVDLDEEAVGVHHELAHDHLVHDFPADGLVGSVEDLEQVAAAEDPEEPASLTEHREPLDLGGVHAPGRLGHRGVGGNGDDGHGHEVAGGGAGRLVVLGPAPLGPERRDVGVGVRVLLFEEQVGLGHDAEHQPGVVHHRHRADPVLGQAGHDLLERCRRPDGHHLGCHQVLDQAVHWVLPGFIPDPIKALAWSSAQG